MYFINIFLFYSIMGNIGERIVMNFFDRTYVSGFMGTFFTPVYGIGVLLVLYLHDKIKIKNKYFKMLVEFFIYAILLGIVEYIGGVLIENIFNKVFWNFDNYKFNIGIYTSLETMLLWGMISLLVIYIINPFVKKIEKYIPKLVTIIVSLVFVINLIYVFIVK